MACRKQRRVAGERRQRPAQRRAGMSGSNARSGDAGGRWWLEHGRNRLRCQQGAQAVRCWTSTRAARAIFPACCAARIRQPLEPHIGAPAMSARMRNAATCNRAHLLLLGKLASARYRRLLTASEREAGVWLLPQATGRQERRSAAAPLYLPTAVTPAAHLLALSISVAVCGACKEEAQKSVSLVNCAVSPVKKPQVPC
jgi:hypothetical protein